MKNPVRIFCLSFCLCLLGQMVLSQHKDSLRYGILLDRAMLDSIHLKDNFIGAVDISPEKYVVLATARRIHVLGWLGIDTVGSEAPAVISSFCFSRDSVLMIISGKDLYTTDTTGNLVMMLKLPNANMGLSAGGEVVYCYDKALQGNKNKCGLYALARGGRYKKLMTSPQPISSVVEMNKMIFVAIGSAIYTFNPAKSELQLVAGLQKEFDIKSMTADYVNDILYFATQEGIYAYKNEKLSYVTGDFGGGFLKYFDNGLLLFNPSTKDIMRITGISKKVVTDF